MARGNGPPAAYHGHMCCSPLVWEVPTARVAAGQQESTRYALSSVIEGPEGRRRDNGDGRATYPIRRADGEGTDRRRRRGGERRHGHGEHHHSRSSRHGKEEQYGSLPHGVPPYNEAQQTPALDLPKFAGGFGKQASSRGSESRNGRREARRHQMPVEVE